MDLKKPTGRRGRPMKIFGPIQPPVKYSLKFPSIFRQIEIFRGPSGGPIMGPTDF